MVILITLHFNIQPAYAASCTANCAGGGTITCTDSSCNCNDGPSGGGGSASCSCAGGDAGSIFCKEIN